MQSIITCAAESFRYSGGTLAMRNGTLPVHEQRSTARKRERVRHTVHWSGRAAVGTERGWRSRKRYVATASGLEIRDAGSG